MANVTLVRNTGRPGSTVNILDRRTGKVIATATADTKGFASLSVPPGSWEEQIVYTLSDSGQNKTITQNAPSDTEVGIASAQHGPVVTSPDGSVWQLTVSNVGAVSATKLA